MKVGELIERALYLSIKDRYFNALPKGTIEKNAILEEFLPEFNNILVGIGKKNPAFSTEKVNSEAVKIDPQLNMTYIELEKKFLTLFRVEFLYSGSTFSITLTRLGMNDFFSNSDLRTIYTFPAFYNYNVFSDKLYIYPKPSVTGSFNLFGKEKVGPFTSVEDDFPSFLSETFLLYVEYYFAKFICSQYNAPWQAQKDELLKNYSRLVDSENNISYQEISIYDGKSSIPVRNTRIGL